MSHQHIWTEAERFYAPPLPSGGTISGPASDVLLSALLGVTTILYRCQAPVKVDREQWGQCGEVRTERILGKSTT